MPEIAKCSKCSLEYTSKEDLDMVKSWIEKNNYAPCPNVPCSGQLTLVEEKDD